MLEYYCFIFIYRFSDSKYYSTAHKQKKHRKHFIYQVFAAIFSGKEGIRTPEALLTLTRFPGGPLQPLEHLSVGLIFSKIGGKSNTFSPYGKTKDKTFSSRSCIPIIYKTQNYLLAHIQSVSKKLF